MFTNRIYIQAVMLLAIALFIASCGGSSNIGAISTGQITDSRITAGVTLGDFEVLRYNADGFTDPAMNNTIELSLEGENLVISVEDGGINAVAIDVKYNKGSVHPGSVEFSGLLGPDGKVLNASFNKDIGVVGLASAPIGDVDLGGFNGEFATIAFPAGAIRTVSVPGDVHHGQVGQTHLGAINLFGAGDPLSSTATVSWTTAFHTADGDQNSETNTADLTPIAIHFGKVTTTNWEAAVADYDENTEVNLSDIQRIVLYFMESSHGFVLAFADDDGAGRVDFPGNPIMWLDKAGPTGAPVNGDFFTAFDNWTQTIDESSSFNYEALTALDVNEDGFVMAYVANAKLTGDPPVLDQKGIESSVLVPVGPPPTDPAQVIIDDYEIKVVGDAIAAEAIMSGKEFGLTSSALTANRDVQFTLYNVIGKFEGEFFDKDTLPTVGSGSDEKTMTPENYQDIFDACLALISWQYSDTGATGIRHTETWFIPTPSPDDDPNFGTVFPDDDPQSDVTLDPPGIPEGLLETGLPPGGEGMYPWDDEDMQVTVLAQRDYDLMFDIELDPIAAEITSYSVTEFELVIENELVCELTFGTGGFPADPSSTALQIVPIQLDGWAFDPDDDLAPNWLDLTYFDGELSLGQYSILDIGDGTGILLAMVNGGALAIDTSYAVRIQDAGVWSSINKPDDTIMTREFTAPDVIVLPEVCGTDVTVLQLFPSDPKVRRNGKFQINMITGEAEYPDEEAFFDVLKDSTEDDAEFLTEFDPDTFRTFPKLVVVEAASPSAISGPNDPNAMTAGGIIARQGNKLTVDIALFPRPGTPTEPNKVYSFRLFTKDGAASGEGTFECIYLDLAPVAPIAIDWCVNLWDRVEGSITELGPSFYDAGGALIDGTTVGTPTPDVLWFEFSGGWVFLGPDNSIYADIYAEHATNPDNFGSLDMQIEIAGLTADKHYLGFHTLELTDFFHPVFNPSGLFMNTGTYRFRPADIRIAEDSDDFVRIATVAGVPIWP